MLENCSIYQGRPEHYQEQALISIVESGKRIWPWSWVDPICGSAMCLEPDHLELTAPRSLSYPPYTCVYCGGPSDTRDHIIPTALTGVARRSSVLTVPACRECNSMIGAALVFSLDGRREIAHLGIRKKYAKFLKCPNYSDDEISEFEGMLKQSVLSAMAGKRDTLNRLAWPEEEDYDLKHLQQSGIDNPFVSGLLEATRPL